MSNKTQDLNKLKKTDLIGVVNDLQEKLASIKVEDSPQDTSAKVSNLVNEIHRLQDELKKARETEKFVAIENLSLGRVWLYAPESKSGRPEDANKGRLLKQTGEIAIVPSYWMVTYIADRAPAFSMGEIRINNEKGRDLSPNLMFEDFDLPPEFEDAVVPNEEINKAISGSAENFYDFVDKYRKQPFILSRAFGIIDREAFAAKEKSTRKSILEGYVSFLDEVLHPAPVEEKETDETQINI
jgi:hypothetical protein